MENQEIQEIPDFLKDFIVEAPADTIDKKEKEIKDKTDTITTESTPSLEDLKKELEGEEEEEDEIEVKEIEDKSTKEKKETKEDKTTEYSFKPFIEIMAEQGVLDLEDGEEFGETAEDLVTVFEKTVSTRINQGIEEYKESVPELGKAFLDYLDNGGDPRKFIEVQSTTIDFDTIDLTDEANQKLVVKEYLKSQDYSKEEIEETLQDFEDGLVLEKQAKLAVRKLEKLQEKATENLIKEQEKQVEVQRKQLTEYVTKVQDVINNSKEIAGLPVTDKERKEFESYLFKKDKSGYTEYQRELAQDPHKTQVELAFLKFKKYDFGKVAKKAESTAAAKLREKVLAKTETTVKGATADNTSSDSMKAFEKMFGSIRKK